jgi:isopentenyldiphosphate isomerase
VRERCKLVHHSSRTAVVLQLAFGIFVAVLEHGRKIEAVFHELLLTECLEFFLGGESGSVSCHPILAHLDPPGLLEIMQEEGKQRVREREGDSSSECGIKRIQMACIIHAISDVVDEAAGPSLVVMRRPLNGLEQLAVVPKDVRAACPVRLIDEFGELVDREVIQDQRDLSHGCSFQRTGWSIRILVRWGRGRGMLYNPAMEDEYLDLVDVNDKVVGKKLRSEVYAEKLTNFRVVNAFVINSEGRLWIPRRGPNKRIFPLCLDMSMGGHVESGEEYDTSFKRELAEELRIDADVTPWKVLGNLTSEDGVSAFMRVYEIQYDAVPDFNTDDFVEYWWMTPEEVLEKIEGGEAAKGDLVKLVKRFYLG